MLTIKLEENNNEGKRDLGNYVRTVMVVVGLVEKVVHGGTDTAHIGMTTSWYNFAFEEGKEILLPIP